MPTKPTRRPAPALIVAIIALVAALTGSAIALPGRNSVDSNDIQKGAVKAKQIAKNAIKSKHVKNDSLKGADIKESSLGKVPAAAEADALAGTIRVWKKVAPSGSGASDAAARAAATKVPLGGAGPFTVYGKCFVNTNVNDVNAEIYIESTETGGILSGYSADYLPAQLGPATDEDDRKLVDYGAALDDADMYDYGNFSAISTSGLVLSGNAGIYAKHGTLATGDGAFGPGDVCIFRYEQHPTATVENG